MPQSESYARKSHILTLLKSSNAVTVSSIVESLDKLQSADGKELKCTDKTVIRDIKELKSMGCPIFWRRSLNSYELRDKSWEMPPNTLITSLATSAFSIDSLAGSSCLPQQVWKHVHLLPQTSSEGGDKHSNYKTDFSTLRILTPPIDSKTEGVFSTVYQAWATHHLLKIVYTDAWKNQTTRTIEPQAMLFYDMTWYVRAWCYYRNEPRTFAMSRIEKAEIEDNTFSPRPEVYEDANFDNFIDRNRDEYKDIKIRLTTEGRLFAIDHPLHSKQEINDNEGQTFTMTVPRKAKHLAMRWIMNQAGNAIPLAPAEFVDDVIAQSKAIMEKTMALKGTQK